MNLISSSEIAAEAGFWKILSTTEKTQVAIMNLGEGQVSGEYGTDHPQSDQVLYCLSGSGTAIVEGKECSFAEGDLLVIVAGERHQIKGGPCRTLNCYGPVAYDGE